MCSSPVKDVCCRRKSRPWVPLAEAQERMFPSPLEAFHASEIGGNDGTLEFEDVQCIDVVGIHPWKGTRVFWRQQGRVNSW